MRIEPLDLSEARAAMKPAPRASGPSAQQRYYEAALLNRLNFNWNFRLTSKDQELWEALPRLRGRMRDLANNDPNAKKYLRLVQKNVVGSEGIRLQSKVMLQRARGGTLRPNEPVNRQIEDAFRDWGTKPNRTISADMTWISIQRLVASTVAMDGECLLRKISRPDLKHGFALQLIDADLLDFFWNSDTPTGNSIRMGVEKNKDGRVVAYHVFDRHPSEFSQGPRQRRRIPADEIIHVFLREYITQSRGVPWMTTASERMNMLKQYQQAETAAAAVSAKVLGGIKKDLPESGQYNGEENKQDATGAQAMDTEDAMFVPLAPGEDFTLWKPEHPNTAFESFCKGVEHNIAAGLDVSYMSLSGDLNGTSYSSGRIGLVDERDTWKTLQTWLIEELCEPVFEAWLTAAFLTSLKSLPGTSPEDYDADFWHPRSFPWVDPKNDAEASRQLVQVGFNTRTDILASQGKDFSETADEWLSEVAAIQEKAKKLGISETIIAALLTCSTEVIRDTGAAAAESAGAATPPAPKPKP